MSDLISILMPVKNAGAFLVQCVDSILEQGTDKWELIAIDDHSSDESPEILKHFAERDNRIRTFRNEGSGIPDALLTALEHSAGELVTRMDADDIMAKRKLKKLSGALLKSGKKHVAISKVKYFAEGELGAGYQRYEKWLNQLTASGKNFTEIYRECTIPSPSWMLFRDDIESYGLLENLSIPEDYDLAFRLYKNKFGLATVNAVLHFWRDHEKRISREKPEYNIRAFGLFKLRHFLENEITNKEDLVIWGSGRKGKEICRNLIKREIQFTWITDNKLKHGLQIYDTQLSERKVVAELRQPKVIIAVSKPEDQRQITNYLHRFGLKPGVDYFSFF